MNEPNTLVALAPTINEIDFKYCLTRELLIKFEDGMEMNYTGEQWAFIGTAVIRGDAVAVKGFKYHRFESSHFTLDKFNPEMEDSFVKQCIEECKKCFESYKLITEIPLKTVIKL